jgi:hypothetical protein
MILFSSIALLLSLLSLSISKHKGISYDKSSAFEFFGITGIVLSLFFGFLILGVSVPVSEVKTEIKDYDILKGKYHLILDVKEDIEILANLSVYKIIESNKPFKIYKIVEKNSYGGDLSITYLFESIKE